MKAIANPHALKFLDVIEKTQSSTDGLSQHEALTRLKLFGPNQIPSAQAPHLLAVFVRQFYNPLIYILLIVGLISLLTGQYSDAGFILGVLLINAVVGTTQEYSAEKSALALKKISSTRCVVIRDHQEREIDSSEIVMGDIILLESGNKVPADMRLILTQGLEIDESLLTGESHAVGKNEQASIPVDSNLGDRVNMAFSGTLVTRGRGRGVVCSTGSESELGKIAQSVFSHENTKTPLLIRMEYFTKKLALYYGLAVIVISAFMISKGRPLMEVLFFAVALGVAAIPEGLPVALTVALAVASRRMAKRNVIVRKLASVEALGSCTFIGSDKTGTLTLNELTVKAVQLPHCPLINIPGHGISFEEKIEIPHHALKEQMQTGLRALAQTVSLCNEAVLNINDGQWAIHGDAVDVALLVLAQKVGPDEWKEARKIAEIPFESELQFAASLHVVGNKKQVISVKGAPEKIISMSNLGPEEKNHIMDQSQSLASQGHRVLAITRGVFPTETFSELKIENLVDLDFLGLVGMIDPPRKEAKKSIQEAKIAGLMVAMITGDHPITALSIAKEVGLANNQDKMVTGLDLLNAKNDHEFDQVVRDTKIFARVAPQQKLEITKSLIRQGHFVAITGDGANDAPALKAAHVGVAMGESGTEVAKETSDLIISDDRFSSIIAGIEEGRLAYANVRKVIYLLISTGAAEIVIIALSLFASMPLPLTAIQLLWLNLVTEGVQHVALAFDPRTGDELKSPPRKVDEPIFNTIMIQRVALSALAVGGACFGVYLYLSKLGMELKEIQNHILFLMVIFENVMVGNARSETKSAFIKPFSNPFLVLGTLSAQLIHISAMYFEPVGKIIGASPIALKYWLSYLMLGLVVFFVIELHKYIWRLNHPVIRSSVTPDQQA